MSIKQMAIFGLVWGMTLFVMIAQPSSYTSNVGANAAAAQQMASLQASSIVTNPIVPANSIPGGKSGREYGWGPVRTTDW